MTNFGTYFGIFGYLNGFLYWEKYYLHVFQFLERYIYAFVAKLSDRCFCWFPAAMLVPWIIEETGLETIGHVQCIVHADWLRAFFNMVEPSGNL